MNIYESHTRFCELPGCSEPLVGKSHWVRFCCRSHQAKYSGKLSRGALDVPTLTTTQRQARGRAAFAKCRKGLHTPSWVDDSKILAIYEQAAKMTEETGILDEVDHVDPINHHLVCGLHCPENLQIITKDENREKNNRWTPYEIRYVKC